MAFCIQAPLREASNDYRHQAPPVHLPLPAQLLRLARDLWPVGRAQGCMVDSPVMTTHPPKELVRAYMAKRTQTESPPPSPQQVREQLGWHMIPENGYVPEVQE